MPKPTFISLVETDQGRCRGVRTVHALGAEGDDESSRAADEGDGVSILVYCHDVAGDTDVDATADAVGEVGRVVRGDGDCVLGGARYGRSQRIGVKGFVGSAIIPPGYASPGEGSRKVLGGGRHGG